MPLKLSVGINRKKGEANFGSRGATVGLELELDASLVDRPQQLHERIAQLFRLAKESVDRELSGQAAAGVSHTHQSSAAIAAGQPPVRPATANQIRAIHAIANRQNLNLVEELRNRFGVYRADDLSLEQASDLIDAIKPSANGAAAQP